MRALVVAGVVAVLCAAACAKSEVPCEGAQCSGPDAEVITGPCGNGDLDDGEACDDGYADACGSCNADCSGPGSGSTCGDGQHCPEAEVCDDGYNDACGSCNEACLAAGSGATCGDGSICPETEVCDDGYVDACGSCNADCSGIGGGAACGDGQHCPEAEVCDDGHNDACGSCNADCSAAGAGAACGDSFVCPELESCDVGPDPCHVCNASCTGGGSGPICGDNLWCQSAEQCEDGNTSNGDGCSSTCQNECNPGNDISGSASGSISAGSTDQVTYGPAKLNDGHYEGECASFQFCWITASSSPGSAYFQYNWSAAVPVRRIAIDTTVQGSSNCAGSGRNLAGATVQWWNGSGWVTAGTVSGQTNDWSFVFPSTVTTTAIRLYGAYTSTAGQGSNPVVFEWDVFSCI